MLKYVSMLMIVLVTMSFLPSVGLIYKAHASSIIASSPSFSLRVTPLSQTVAITGTVSYNVQVVPIGGFNSLVALSLTTGSSFISPSFNPESISPGQSSELMVTAGSGIQVGSYSMTLTGTSGSLSETQTLSLTVTEVTGIKNLVLMNDFSISDSGGALVLAIAGVRLAAVLTSCFSIQQNFYVTVPGKAMPTYWAQNVLLIGTTPLGHIDVWSTYNIYDATNMGYPIAQNLVPRIPGTGEISVPAVFTLTSKISGDQLDLTSDYNSFTFSLGATGAYVSQLSDARLLPQLDVVGGVASAKATFSSSTDGAVASSVELANDGWTYSVTQSLLVGPNSISTGETSLNLGWTLSENTPFTGTNGGADFEYSNGANIEGVGFVPSPAVVSIFMENGAVSTYDSSTGVVVNIAGSTAPDNSIVQVSFVRLDEQPSDTAQLSIEAFQFYDVGVSGAYSSGTATVYITNPSISSQTTAMQYYQNGAWVDAAGISVIGDTIQGDISVSSLAGTPIIVGKDLVTPALDWLRGQQSKTDWSWAYFGTENVGITALCALTFLNRGVMDNHVESALDWIVSKKQADGSLNSGAVNREDNRVYETSMAILALVAGKTLGYYPSDGTNLNDLIKNAANFLLKCQCVGHSLDGYTYGPDNPSYGGWGYPRYDWADLSNTQWALLGLAAASTAGCTIPLGAWQNAAVFTIRCLSDANRNPKWHGANDGGFGYGPSGGSYESMTGAGVWSLGLCKSAGISSITVDGVTVSLDDAINDGVNWLQAYASVDQDYPNGNSWYYYALISVAKGYVIVNKGLDWYQKMVNKLGSTQASDGHWPEIYFEEPDIMGTAEALLAIETRMLPPPSIPTKLYVILGSYSNLYITDPDGRHIGIDPSTGQTVSEIPGATFSNDSEQIAAIPDPVSGVYNITVFGIGTGPYNLTVEGEINGTVTPPASFPGTIFQGGIVEWTARVIVDVFGPLVIIVSPPQYQITLNQTGIGNDYTGTVMTIDGTNYTASNLPASFLWDNGSTHSFAFQSPLVVGSGAKEYHWTSTNGLSASQSGSITVTGVGSVTGNYGVHDVAVADIIAFVPHCSSKVGNDLWVFQGLQVQVNVTVLNRGDFDENVNVTLYYNITAGETIGTKSITIPAGENETLSFLWETEGAPYCQNYTLTAVATIPLDNNPADNTLATGPITVRIMGDVNGDGKVDGKDIAMAAWSFGTISGDKRWNLDADINQDGKVDGKDLVLIARNFGK